MMSIIQSENGASRRGFGQSSWTPIKDLGIEGHMWPDLFSIRELKVKPLCAVDVCDRLQH